MKGALLAKEPRVSLCVRSSRTQKKKRNKRNEGGIEINGE